MAHITLVKITKAHNPYIQFILTGVKLGCMCSRQ